MILKGNTEKQIVIIQISKKNLSNMPFGLWNAIDNIKLISTKMMLYL